MQTFDLEQNDLRTLNATLHAQKTNTNQTAWNIINPIVAAMRSQWDWMHQLRSPSTARLAIIAPV